MKNVLDFAGRCLPLLSGGGKNSAQSGEGTPLGCTPEDLAITEGIVTRSGTSFAAGMKILEPARRYGMFAVYAFCRLVDDIADGDAGVEDRAAALDGWKLRIAALYAGSTEDALDRVLSAAISRFALRQEDFDAVIDGMKMDASGPIVAPDEATLDLYCDRVASAVGRLSVRIFGDSSVAADQVAYHLGRALQLTNILRDIAADARLGRLYLPASLLDRYGIKHDPATICIAAGLDGVCSILAARAKDHFRDAFQAMKKCDRGAMLPARLMAGKYMATMQALEKRGWDMPLIPVRVSAASRAVSVLCALAE